MGGCGKTTLMQYMARSKKRILIFDPNNEPKYMQMATKVCFTQADLYKAIQAKTFVIAWRGYTTYRHTPEVFETAFLWPCHLADAAEDLLIIWDEFDVFCSAHSFPQIVQDIGFTGRHRGLATMAVSRAPNAIPRMYTRNVQRWLVFRTTEPTDIDYFRKVLGPGPAKELPTLQRFSCYDKTEKNGVILRQSPFD